MDEPGTSSREEECCVVGVQKCTRVGVYAPLTSSGTVVVDDVVCSCYASPRLLARSIPVTLALAVGGRLESLAHAVFGEKGSEKSRPFDEHAVMHCFAGPIRFACAVAQPGERAVWDLDDFREFRCGTNTSLADKQEPAAWRFMLI